VGVPGRKTKETLTSADAIMDALDTAGEEIKRLNQHKVVTMYYRCYLLVIS
jgi:U3 small nucleolar RNA-associated protein 12